MELLKRYGILYVLLLTLTHCAGPDERSFMPDCTKFRCDVEALTYQPESALVGVTQAALERFGVATGRTELRIEEGGVPVLFREHIVGKDGKEICAVTTAVSMNGGRNYTQRIEIDPTPPPFCPSADLSILHELIHSLAPDVDHAADGLFAPVIGGPFIDEPAMVQLCSEFDCQTFEPEL